MENKRVIVSVREPTPLMGSVAFGVIDRGTNVIQVRPTSVCGLCCVFCSVDAGPCSRRRWADFQVDDLEWMRLWVEEIAKFKGERVEALIDGAGDPLEHPKIDELVALLKESRWVKSVALETHGRLLDYKMAMKLNDAGLDRINLSLDTLDDRKGKLLSQRKDYSVSRVKEVVEWLVKNTRIDVHVTPLWIPGVNDEDVKEVIAWAKRIGVGKRWPPFTVQKYVVHKHGRKVKGVRELTWEEFWKKLEEWEKELGVRLRWNMSEWGMKSSKKVPEVYKVGEKVKVEIISRGLFKGEWLGIPLPNRDRVITVIGDYYEIGERVKVKIIANKDNIYLAR